MVLGLKKFASGKALCIALLLCGCTQLERDNIYDPDGANYDPGAAGIQNYCVYPSTEQCFSGSYSSCPGDGEVSDFCPFSSPSESLCAGFAEGTEREHYGKNKKQFCDERDGNKYVYVKIGERTWMAEGLNYDASGSKCYDDDPVNCAKYGRLYDWLTAMTACPDGWSLPSYYEWTELTAYVEENSGCSDCAGTKLKATSDWNDYQGAFGAGTDNYGFSALPGGYGSSGGGFYNIGILGHWWSTSENSSLSAYLWYIYYGKEDTGWYNDDKSLLFSVRCVEKKLY
jgi:uncharacterized protein (TIGR02145 family)